MKVAADAPDFIFEEVAQGLDQLELHPQRQSAHVVVALDGLAGTFDARRLDNVGIERALHQPFHAAGFFRNARGLVVEDGDELRANALAFGLGINNAGQLIEEAFAGVNGDDFQAQLVAQIFLHILEFVLAQDAVIDKDAGELGADGPVYQHCRD